MGETLNEVTPAYTPGGTWATRVPGSVPPNFPTRSSITPLPPGVPKDEYTVPMRFPDEVTEDVHKRLRRVEGQIRGIQRLIDEGADCKDVVTQLSAAQAALHKVGYRLVAAGLQHCVTSPDEAAAGGMTTEEFERLFLKLG